MIEAERTPLVVASFNEGLAVSGITTWNFRMAAAFAATPQLGIDWRIVEVAEAGRLRELRAIVPANLGRPPILIERGRDENRWTVARRLLRSSPELSAADVIVPNHCSEGWLVAVLRRRCAGEGPAVVGIVHSDDGRFYAACGTHVSPLDAVVAVSRRCRDEFARYCPDRPPAELAPYGVPVAKSDRDNASIPPCRIVYSGRLETHQKRVLDLAPLAQSLVARNIEFEMHIAGSGSAEPELRSALNRIAPARAHFHGSLPPDRVLELLKSCHVFVLVSEFEGTSVAMLEAMGQGLTPIVTNVSGASDVIEPDVNGWIVPVGDMNSMADRIAALAREPALLRRVGRAARETIAARYSLEINARELARIVRTAVAGSRTPLVLKRGHPALGRFDYPWLPNSLTIAARRVAKAVLGRSAPASVAL